MAGALIVTAELAPPDFSWIEALRKAHYPIEPNLVPAHLTMFQALPPSAEAELKARIARLVRRERPSASVAGLIDLGGGVALRIVSPELDDIREELASDLHGLFGAQDSGGWRPHITIQNKVPPSEAHTLKESLERTIVQRPILISGLAVQRYLGGPWERVATYPFR